MRIRQSSVVLGALSLTASLVLNTVAIKDQAHLGRRWLSKNSDGPRSPFIRILTRDSVRDKRHLKRNIFIEISSENDKKPEEPEPEEPEPEPEPEEPEPEPDLPEPRDGFDSCVAGKTVTQEDGVVEVTFYFEIETEGELPEKFEEIVCKRMEQEITGGVYDDVCTDRRLVQRRLGVTINGVGQQMECEVTGSCDPDREKGSDTCTVFKGTVVISYEDDEDSGASAGRGLTTPQGDVEDKVLPVIKDAIEDPGTEWNLDTDLEGGGVDVTEATYTGRDGEVITGFQGDEFVAKEGGGLNAAGKIAVTCMVFLCLVLLLLCCLWRRELRRTRSPGKDAKSEGETFNSAYMEDEDSYLTSDFNNLGLHHSKLDVHECTSATCRVCMARRTEASPPVVQFVSAKGRVPLPTRTIAIEGMPSLPAGVPETIEESDEGTLDSTAEDLASAKQEMRESPLNVDLLLEEGPRSVRRDRKFGWSRFGRGKQPGPYDEVIVDGSRHNGEESIEVAEI